MKTQIFNKTFNIPVSIDNEQFISVGNALDMYTLVNTKLRTIDSVSPAVFDIKGAMNNEKPRVFLIQTDASGDYTFPGGTTEIADSTGMPYVLYDATSYVLAGLYTLDAAGAVTAFAGSSPIGNDKLYVALPICDVPLGVLDGAVKAQAALKAVMNKGVANVMTVTEVDDTVNRTVGMKVNANQYTVDIAKFKVAVIDAKNWKRLQFPFHTAFQGTQYNVGQAVSTQFALDSATQYMLVFFQDTYGNVSFPFIYVVNP